MRHLVAAIAAYCALWLLVPRATFIPLIARAIPAACSFGQEQQFLYGRYAGALIAFAPSIAFMAAQLAIVYHFARLRLNFLKCVLVLLGCVFTIAVLVGAMVVQSHVVERLHRAPTGKEILFIAALYPSLLRMPCVIAMMLAAATVGYMVSLRVTDKNLLVPVLMFAAFIDLWTVTRGPVSVAIKKAPELVSAVSAPIPQAGKGAFVPQFFIGPGDFLFAGLVFAAVNRLKLDGSRNFWFVFAAMTLGMFAIATGVMEYLPALILLALGAIAANHRQFNLSKQEALSIAVVAVVLAVALPLVWSIVDHKR